MFILRNFRSNTAQLECFETLDELNQQNLGGEDYKIEAAADLLNLYMDTDNNSDLMSLLKNAREYYLDDLDLVPGAAEVTGLIVWLMADYGVDHRGETLEATAGRLSDIDIEADTDQHTDLIFHLKDAVERLYDIEMDDWD